MRVKAKFIVKGHAIMEYQKGYILDIVSNSRGGVRATVMEHRGVHFYLVYTVYYKSVLEFLSNWDNVRTRID